MLLVPGYPRPKVWGVFCCCFTKVVFCAPGLSLFLLRYASDWNSSLFQGSPGFLPFLSMVFYFSIVLSLGLSWSRRLTFKLCWVFFCLIRSVTEASIFFLIFLLRIVHLVGWVLFCGSLLVTFSWWCVLGVLVLGLIHSIKSVALSYHNLWGCSPPYFFLTWSQEDCRAKIRKPVCLLYFIF